VFFGDRLLLQVFVLVDKTNFRSYFIFLPFFAGIDTTLQNNDNEISLHFSL
jgi:hypothetical protein